MSDYKAEAARIERLKCEDIFSPQQVIAIYEALEAAEKRGRDAERKRIKRAWAIYWDCSAHPGHAAFDAALDGLEHEPEDEE